MSHIKRERNDRAVKNEFLALSALGGPYGGEVSTNNSATVFNSTSTPPFGGGASPAYYAIPVPHRRGRRIYVLNYHYLGD
jgi:hypothetical protein